MIVFIDDETETKLEKYKKTIIQSIEHVIELVHTSYNYQQKIEAKKRQENPYIVKSVIKYMAKGLNKQDAILMTATDFETTTRRVADIFWAQNRYMSAINLYARRYTCEKLKEAGLTAKEIAKIIGVSENHVFKMLHNKADFWFLNTH